MAPPDWDDRERIDERIEKHRKGDIKVTFVDSSGNPVSVADSLKLTLVQHDFPFGTAYEADGKHGEELEWYNETAAKMFNALVPQWKFKWQTYEHSKGSYQKNYKYLMDTIIDLAEKHKMVLVRGHCLDWFNSEHADHWSRKDGPEAYREYLKTRITRDVGLFKGKFQHYDVFNEVVHKYDLLDEWQMWDTTFKDAFRWAHEVDPDAKLMLNDYGLISGGDKELDRFCEIVADLQKDGVPFHGIGIQAYMQRGGFSMEKMKDKLDRLSSFNVPLYITEALFCSERLGNGKMRNTMTEQEQANMYDHLISLWFSYPNIKGILMWGFWDPTIKCCENGGIYNEDRTPKLAAKKIYKLWHEKWHTEVSENGVDLGHGYNFRGFFGRYKYVVHAGGRDIDGEFVCKASDGKKQEVVVQLAL